MYKNLFLKIVLSLSVISLNVKAQPYPPIVGQPGSTAIYKDSSAFVNWVTSCNVVRGLQDVSTPTLGLANGGDSSMVIGIAGTNGVVSLGDGGSAICTFQYPIKTE
jgi:hypothetical protein